PRSSYGSFQTRTRTSVTPASARIEIRSPGSPSGPKKLTPLSSKERTEEMSTPVMCMSTLHGTGGQPANDVLLQCEEQDEDGQARDHAARGEQTPIRVQLARDPLIHADGEGPVRLAGEDDSREDEVAERADEAQQ